MNRQIVFLIPLVLFGSGCWPSSSSEASASTSLVANTTSDDVPIHQAAKHVMYPPSPKKIDVQVSQGLWIIGGRESTLLMRKPVLFQFSDLLIRQSRRNLLRFLPWSTKRSSVEGFQLMSTTEQVQAFRWRTRKANLITAADSA